MTTTITGARASARKPPACWSPPAHRLAGSTRRTPGPSRSQARALRSSADVTDDAFVAAALAQIEPRVDSTSWSTTPASLRPQARSAD
jgi:hypothetical protein